MAYYIDLAVAFVATMVVCIAAVNGINRKPKSAFKWLLWIVSIGIVMAAFEVYYNGSYLSYLFK